MYKECTKCGTKPINQFSKSKKEKDGLQSSCKACTKLYHANHYKENKDKIDQQNKNWYENNKEKRIAKITEYKRERRKADPIFKLIVNIRRRTNRALKAVRWSKSSKFNEYIGCTKKELDFHLTSQFQPGMSWENYGDGLGSWSLDHIKPLSLAKNELEIYSLCHYSNLRPMWHIDNLKKSNKVGI